MVSVMSFKRDELSDMVYNLDHSFFSGDKEDVLNVEDQYINGIYTPDFLEKHDDSPDFLEEHDESENNPSLANVCTPAATKKRKNFNSEFNTA